MIRILKPRLWGRGRGAEPITPAVQMGRPRPRARRSAARGEEGGASSLEGRVAPGPPPSCLPPPLRLCPLPCLCPRHAACCGASHGGGTGGGVAAPGCGGLRAAGAGLLRLQGRQHPGQVGVAGEVPRLGECPPAGPRRRPAGPWPGSRAPRTLPGGAPWGSGRPVTQPWLPAPTQASPRAWRPQILGRVCPMTTWHGPACAVKPETLAARADFPPSAFGQRGAACHAPV